MKFIDVCRALPRNTEVELTEFTEDMETQNKIGKLAVKDILFGFYWNKYCDYYVLSIVPLSKTKVSIKVVKD